MRFPYVGQMSVEAVISLCKDLQQHLQGMANSGTLHVLIRMPRSCLCVLFCSIMPHIQPEGNYGTEA